MKTKETEDELGDGATIVMLALIITVTIIFFITSGIGEVLHTSRGPSEQELCEQRGGVYVIPRYGPTRCFSKEALK